MKSGFNFFDIMFCINLDSRADRWNQCLIEFDKVGIKGKVIRIPGILFPNNPCHGNHLAHAKCFEIAKRYDTWNCLIFEDDVEFFDNAVDTLTKAAGELNYDWDMLYLGANVISPAEQVNTHLAKLTGAFATHAYAVKYNLFTKLMEINLDPNIVHNDEEYSSKIVPNYNSYVTLPLVAGQRDGFSDIMHREISSNQMFKERLEGSLKRL